MQSVSKSIYRGKLLSSLPVVGEIHKEIAVSEETVTWISATRDYSEYFAGKRSSLACDCWSMLNP